MFTVDPSIPAHTPLSKLPNFDARIVPALAIDSDLPPVLPPAWAPDALRRRFANPPAWEPEIRQEQGLSDRPETPAAVLVALVQRERTMVLLTERTTHLSTHSGQIAFPGGKCDPTDLDVADTALREAEEEIGLERGLAEVLGTLPTYRTFTQFVVTPVVALVRPDHRLALNAHEVADAFEVPLEFLMNPAHHRHHALEFGGARREWLSMPYMDGSNERFIWGATAAMLRNFYRFLSA
jgi:8-oxo-dGTP pyrophosphatase MutT (NUDIX family)